jgi:two-component system, OmpR family, response regulator VanR
MQTEAVSIVVADDDRAIANLLCDILGDEGYHVICCASGQEAIKAIQEHKPAVAILDMQMETRTAGFEVIQLLRSDASMRHIPVILYSADSRLLQQMREQLLAHLCELLAKPFYLQDLLSLIERLIPLTEREV